MTTLEQDLVARLSATPGAWRQVGEVQPEGATFNECQSALAALAREGVVESRRRERDLPQEYKIGSLPTDLSFAEKLPDPWRWTKERGPYPGVYLDKRPSGRVFWAANWICGKDVRGADRFGPLRTEGELSKMPWPALWYEARGVVEANWRWGDHVARELVDCAVDREPPVGRAPLEALLGEARRGYAEYLSPWSWEAIRGLRLFSYPEREDWPLPAGALRELKIASGKD